MIIKKTYLSNDVITFKLLDIVYDYDKWWMIGKVISSTCIMPAEGNIWSFLVEPEKMEEVRKQ